MKRAQILLAALLLAPALASLSSQASESVKLDRAQINERDQISLQRGAHVYVNYCLGCHGAGYMRYDRLKAFGLTEQQIKASLIFTDAKVGDVMNTSMDAKSAKEWFGAAPPDLTVIARSRASGDGSGADWLYTYLRSFYRDSSRPTGWNNTIFPNVGMPHVLYQLQGQQVLKEEEVTLPGGHKEKRLRLVLDKPGSLSPVDYDRTVADLVNFLAYMAEPGKQFRVELGIYVLMFLGVLFVLAYALKKEYWKDVH